MANPQAENGHIDIANEIAEALMRVNLSPYESRVLWMIFRKTYGWNKKSDWITLRQFMTNTGLDRRLAHRAVHSLFDRNIIVISRDDRGRVSYSFQKNYTIWKVSSPKMTVISRDDKLSSAEMTSVIGRDDGLSSVEMIRSTKDTLTKTTLQKKDGIPYQEIIDYLNQKTGKRFTLKPKATINHINARWAEGYTLEDFKTVIDNKCTSWLTDGEMGKYLRPETLFGSKFESYLNEIKHPLAGKVSDTTIKNLAVLNEWSAPP